MKVAIGADHGGFDLKEFLKLHLVQNGFEVEDFGTMNPDSVDYALIAEEVGEFVVKEKIPGILCCGTGIGISIAANKVRGVRAACCSDYFSAKMTRAHNDANILCLGGRVVGQGLAAELVDVFLSTEFEGGRHQRRIDQITEIENKQTEVLK